MIASITEKSTPPIDFSKLPVDCILFNGKVITVDEDFRLAEAIAIGHGRILHVGRNQETKSLAGQETEMIDLEGQTVIPGLIDTHAHIDNMVSLLSSGEPIDHVESIADIVKVVQKGIKKAGPGEWVVTAKDWRESQIRERRLPTRWELDPVSPENPVVVQRTGHKMIVNSFALNLAGITKDTQPIPGGEIGKDKDSGEPNGILYEAQQGLIRNLLPAISYETKIEKLEEALQMLASVGLTGALTTQHYPDEPNIGSPPFEAYFDLYSRNKIPLRLTVALRPELETLISETDQVMQAYVKLNGRTYSGFGGALIKVSPVGEISFDMEANDKKSTMPLSELERILISAHKYNLRIQTHESSDFNLEGFKRVSKKVEIPGRRWIALHCNQPHEGSLDLLKKLDMIVVTQPSRIYYATKDPLYVPLKEFSKRGITFCLGSDWPSDGRHSHNPFQVIYAAITRKDRHGRVHFPEQAVNRQEALKGYTINNAFLTYEEADKGSIEAGKLADLAVISDDILSVSEEKIKDIYVRKTLLGGKVVYE